MQLQINVPSRHMEMYSEDASEVCMTMQRNGQCRCAGMISTKAPVSLCTFRQAISALGLLLLTIYHSAGSVYG